MTAPSSVEIVAFAAGVLAGGMLWRLAVHRTEPEVRVAPGVLHELSPLDERFDVLIDLLDVAVFVVTDRGYIAACNQSARALFGLDDRALGRALIEVVPSIALDRHLSEALGGQSSRGRIDYGMGSAHRRLSVVAHPLRDGRAIVVASDLTRVVELESMRSDFVSNVSHELRTPLSSVKLMVETLLASEGDDEALQMFLPKILSEVNRMVALVHDLLEIARSESGTVRLQRGAMDIRAFASAVLSDFTERARTHGVVLHDDPGGAVMVSADRDRMMQILVNLIDNAIRHTPRGGSVTVRVSEDGPMALVAVSDTGVGIPFKDLPHIFERFYVVDRSRARDVGGTGLGLSIVKQLAEAHGGYVSAESELGRGSTFTCAIPLAPVPARP